MLSTTALVIREKDKPAAYNLETSAFQYNRATSRSNSFIIHQADSGVETYQPQCELGFGNNGRVRLFASQQHPEKVLAVKNPQSPPGSDDQGSDASHCLVSQDEIQGFARVTNREIFYLSQAYPQLSPYLVQHYVNNNATHDFRMLMPYFKGKTLIEFIKNEINHAGHLALLMLKVAAEIDRIHKLGLYHGDLRSGNFICDHSSMIEYGLTSFTVTIIDFDHGGEIGKDRFTGLDEGEGIAFFEIFMYGISEFTDILHLMQWMHESIKVYETHRGRDADLSKNFPALEKFLEKFIKQGDNDDTCKWIKFTESLTSNAIPDFIGQLTGNLSKWHHHLSPAPEKKVAKPALKLFFRKSKEIDMETQWKASEFQLPKKSHGP